MIRLRLLMMFETSFRIGIFRNLFFLFGIFFKEGISDDAFTRSHTHTTPRGTRTRALPVPNF
jgi:hypothetical protein